MKIIPLSEGTFTIDQTKKFIPFDESAEDLKARPAGSLLVRLTGPDAARAAALLEPTSLYGLYALPEYRRLAGDDGLLPVVRVLSEAARR